VSDRNLSEPNFFYNIFCKLKAQNNEHKFDNVIDIDYIADDDDHKINVTVSTGEIHEYYYCEQDNCWYAILDDPDNEILTIKLAILSICRYS
jgi:hypothetical protein